MASPRLRAITMTRSRTVSSSSARGSVVMVISALRQFGADRARQPVLDGGDAVERQRAADPDAEVDEQHRAGRPRPHALDATTPGTRRAIAATRSLTPAGAVSVSVSMVRRPSRQPAMQMKTATTIAAAASAQA